MLEVQKKVLDALSYSKALFKKELKKSLTWLTNDELVSLKQWLKDNFWHTHADVIVEVLYSKPRS